MAESATILVADDDRAIRTVLDQALARLGYDVRTTGNAGTLWRWIEEGLGDLVITDVFMPDENASRPDPAHQAAAAAAAHPGDERAEHPDDRGEGDRARCVRVPAQTVRPKRVGQPERVERALATAPKDGAVNDVGHEVEEPFDEPLPLIGRSPPMQEIYRVLARLMATDLTVMIAARAAPARSWSPGRCTSYGKRRRRARSSPSTWRRSRAT